MSVKTSRTELASITKALSVNWQQTKDYWKDTKRREFERKYIDELLASVGTAVTTIEKIDKLITKVRNDCE